MAPTALAININVASGGTEKSVDTTAAADDVLQQSSSDQNTVKKSLPTQPSASPPLPLPKNDTIDDSFPSPPPAKSFISDHFKDLDVPPGRLGLKLEVDAQGGGGAVILQIDPTCTFRNQVQVGDRIMSIDGRAVKCVDDFLVGMEKVRIFRVVHKGNSDAGYGENSLDGGGNSTTVGGELVQTQKEKAEKKTASPVTAVGKRKRETDGNAPAVVARKNPKSKNAHVKETSNNKKNNQHSKSNSQNQQQQQLKPTALQTKLHLEAKLALEREQKKEKEQKDQQCKVEFMKWQEDWKTYQLHLNHHYINRFGDGWDIRFKELQQYKRTHTKGIGGGNVNKIPLDYRDPNDLTLGEWARLQRELYWEGKLDQERADYLLDEGFDFDYVPAKDVWTGDVEWDGKLKELIEFKKKFLHTNVPAEYPPGQTLGQWVKEQRELYNARTLEKDRHELLEEKGFIFEPDTNVKTTIIHEAWMRNYKELVQFKRDHGHLEVPTGYKASSLSAKLDSWISKQKRKYKEKELPKNQLKLLEDIGLDLTARKRHTTNDKLWDSNYNKLLKYRDEHGHVKVPKRFGQLGPWAGLQRMKFKKGELSEDRTRRLLEIGFDFDPLKKTGDNDGDVTFPPTSAPTTTVFESRVWFDTYEALKSFVETNGHADVPLGYNNDINCCLHTWLETQKRFFEEGKIPERQIQMLEELGINLSEKDDYYSKNRIDLAWTKNFDALKDFHKENGHTDVPFDHIPGNGYGGYRCLATWIQKQREFYKKNRLAQDRIKRLESLGMDLSGRKARHNKSIATLGKMPDDDLWFDHDNGTRRRVPTTWTFPKLSLEETYVSYHCHSYYFEGDKQKKISPMKLFRPSDVENLLRGEKNLGDVKHLCAIIDQECIRKGVQIEGIMTEEEARRCIRIGCRVLAIRLNNDGKPKDVLKMSWSKVRRNYYISKQDEKPDQELTTQSS